MQVPRQFSYMNNKHQELLSAQVKDLPFSDDLKQLLQFNKLATLEDVLNIEVFNWHKKLPGFTMHHKHEIISYL
jgi:hypothetical protein